MASGGLGIPFFLLYVRPFSQGAYLFVSVKGWRARGEGEKQKQRRQQKARGRVAGS